MTLLQEEYFEPFARYLRFREGIKYIDKREGLSILDLGCGPQIPFYNFLVKRNYKIAKYIGAYTAVLNGLDNLVFTAGIGEHIPIVRKSMCRYLKYLDLKIDDKKNNTNSEIISGKNSKIKVYVKKSNEEFMIVKKVRRYIENKTFENRENFRKN